VIRPALLYARMGWRVVPLHAVREGGGCTCGRSECTSPGKHPRLVDWTEEATDDPETIQGWRWPTWNLGVVTGAGSGFIVLDVDGERGRASLGQLLQQHGPLPATTQAETGRGGTHYLLEHPGFRVSNSSSKLAPGLDVRGDGGQIVVPPSRTTGAYRWVVPPWEFTPAPLPEWLSAWFRRAPPVPTAAPASRGYFPPATAAVLDAAREALAAHGPAVEGQGGDEHTFRACALLTHDFALTREEALPLLAEWNELCRPPWNEDDLRAKLSGGERYGTASYGCRRPQDLLEAVRRAAAEHEHPVDLLEVVRPWMTSCRDPALRALVVRELFGATGLGVRALGLPEPAPVPVALGPGEVQVTVQTAEVVDEALKVVAPHIYARNGVLCEVVPGTRAWINDLEVAGILYLLSKHARWVRHDGKDGLVTTSPPPVVAQILRDRRTHPSVRELDAVTGTPVLLADGTILQARGYSEAARLYLEPTVQVDVPEFPARDDARRAVALLADVVSDFRFASSADLSSWLAAVLSPLVKSATGNAPAPLVCVSASSPGAGKTLATEVASLIVTGRSAEVRPYAPRGEESWLKALTAFVRSGAQMNVFDNVNGPFGDPALDRLLTCSSWSDRVLGASEAPPVPVVGTWLATGNNIEPVGDTVRRVLLCRLDVREDRPQERTGFRRPLLAEYALEHRAGLLGAALTVLRAYHVAGRPDVGLAPWGSFGAWSALVRGALVWAGCADPYLTQRRAQVELTEPEHEAHGFWLEVVAASDGTPAGVVAVATQRGAQGLLGLRDQLTVHGLRKLIARFVDRPRLGRRIRRREGVYRVERI
jgi:hypothetical protein